MNINPDWIMLAGIVAILGFLWSLHRDMRSLGERVAKLEGAMSAMTGNIQNLMQVLIDQRSGRRE